jgi:hypothetical protein
MNYPTPMARIHPDPEVLRPSRSPLKADGAGAELKERTQEEQRLISQERAQ